jgi:hypothetical protein
MPLRGTELSKHYRDNGILARELVATYQALEAEIQAAKQQIEPELLQVLADLAEAYLPELTAAAIADVARRAGFKKLQQRDPLQAMAREDHLLKKQVAEIQGDEQYKRREWLVGTNGQLTGELAEATSMLEPWEEACGRFEQHEHFLSLVDTGYDTPDYRVGWLEARYWTFWAAGDRICRELDMDDFGDDVLPAYRQVEAERRRWREQVAQAAAKVEAVHELVRTHDQAVARIPRLTDIYLQASRQALASFLRQADPTLLAQWNDAHAAPERAITLGLRRMAGLRAKLDALTELADRGVRPFISDLEARQNKFARKAAKFARPKHARARHPDAYADPGFSAKSPKYRQRAAQAEQLVVRIVDYDRYDQFDVATNEPELWFREMTGKSPSRMFPSLWGWYDRHPSHRPQRVRDDRGAAAAAAASAVQDDLGYLS